MSSMKICRFDRGRGLDQASSRIAGRLRFMDVIIVLSGGGCRSLILALLDRMVKVVREMRSRRHDGCNMRGTGISLID